MLKPRGYRDEVPNLTGMLRFYLKLLLMELHFSLPLLTFALMTTVLYHYFLEKNNMKEKLVMHAK